MHVLQRARYRRDGAPLEQPHRRRHRHRGGVSPLAVRDGELRRRVGVAYDSRRRLRREPVAVYRQCHCVCVGLATKECVWRQGTGGRGRSGMGAVREEERKREGERGREGYREGSGSEAHRAARGGTRCAREQGGLKLKGGEARGARRTVRVATRAGGEGKDAKATGARKEKVACQRSDEDGARKRTELKASVGGEVSEFSCG